jgi:hypothetical protein
VFLDWTARTEEKVIVAGAVGGGLEMEQTAWVPLDHERDVADAGDDEEVVGLVQDGGDDFFCGHVPATASLLAEPTDTFYPSMFTR